MRLTLLLLFPVFLSAQINRAYGVIEIGATFPTSSATGPKFAYRTVDSSFYRWVSGSTWVKVIPDGSSSGSDTLYLKQISGTTALVNGDTINISTYLLHSDTSSMLTPYIKLAGYGLSKLVGHTLQVDTSVISTKTYTNRFLLKSDTSSMLSKYIERGDTSSMLSKYIERGDTSSMLTKYIERGDTLGMLSAYIRSAGWALLKTAHTLSADSSLLSTKIYTNRFLLKSDTAAMLLRYPSTTGWGFVDGGKTWYVDSSKVASRYYVGANFIGGLGTSTRIPIFTGTRTLGDSPISYNSTTKRTTWDSPGVIELPMGSNAERPSPATTSDFWYNTVGYPEVYNGSSWDEIFTPWQRGSAYTYYGTDLSNTRWDVQISGTQTVGLGIIKDVDYYGMEVGESSTKTGGFYWRNALERVEFTTNANAYPIAFGNNWMYFATDGKVGLGNTSPQRTLHVTGETRLTDLTTDPPTRLVGADADGDLGEVTAGNGINISNSTINSSIGMSWTNTAVSGSPQLIGICYGNNRFVAVSFDGKFFTSTDGRSWMERTAPAANQWASVAFGNGIFVAVSYNGTNRVATSNDGITWTARSAAEANQWISVTYGGNQFVAVSDNGTNRVMTSPDGITWTARSAVSSNWYRVIYAKDIYVAVAYGGTNRVMTSPDGITWTARSAAEANQWRGITFANGLFVAVADSGTNRVMTSSDGTTWIARALTSGSWFDVVYGNGLYVAAGQAGSNDIATSTDAITWTIRAANGGRSIAFEEGEFVAVAFNGTVNTSGSKTIRQPFNNKTNGFQSFTGDLNFRGRRVFSASADTAASSYWGSLYSSETKRNGYFIRDSVLGSGGIQYVFAAHRNGISQGQVSQFSTNTGVIGEHTRFGTTSGSAARYFYGRDDFTSSKTSTGATLGKRSGIQFRGTYGKTDTVFFSVNDQYMGLDTVSSTVGNNYAANRSIFLAFNPDGSYQSAGATVGTDGENGTGVPVPGTEQIPSYRIGKLISSGGITTHEFSALYMPVSWSKVTDNGGALDYVVLGEILKLSTSMAQLYNYGANAKSATALSKTITNQNAAFATDGTILEVERKRDTTIYIVDTDYDFSSALTTAQVGARYNRVIFLMTTTGSAGSDSELTLHTPDANLIQCEYLVRSTDEAGGFANVIRFGTNNAVDSTNGLVSSYFPAAGQGVGIRAGLRSGVYKYYYY